jgi:hypothetical protein
VIFSIVLQGDFNGIVEVVIVELHPLLEAEP